MKENTWPCKHIIKNDACNWVYRYSDCNHWAGDWNVCPICNAKRPEAPKPLRAYIFDNILYDDARTDSKSDLADMCILALKWFKENLPRYYQGATPIRMSDACCNAIDRWIEHEIDKCK